MNGLETIFGLKIAHGLAGLAGGITAVLVDHDLTKRQVAAIIIVGISTSAYLTPIIEVKVGNQIANTAAYFIGIIAYVAIRKGKTKAGEIVADKATDLIDKIN